MAEVNEIGSLRTVPVDSLTPSEANPRVIPARAVEIVAESISEFGWQQPIVADRDGVVIAGHVRLLAARRLGLATVPVVVADKLSPSQVKAYRIADNRTSDFTTWDFPELSAQLEDLAGDFSDVLGLADWSAIVDQLNESTQAQKLEISDFEGASYLSGGHQLTVVCDSDETAKTVAAAVMDMSGVIDVREKR